MGALFEMKVRDRLEAQYGITDANRHIHPIEVVRKVRVQTPYVTESGRGGHRIIDLLVRNTRTGEWLLAVECKAGTSNLTRDQRIRDAWISVTYNVPTQVVYERKSGS